ncbi:MAG: hypothetical protein R6X23_15050 [Acidimicrobiia bacterium]
MKGLRTMEYEFTTAAPITEEEALERVAAMGLHGLERRFLAVRG